LTDVLGPAGIARAWRYNAQNQLLTETQPESGMTTYAYDAAGNLVGKGDANGTIFGYAYDGNERLVTMSAAPAGGGTPRVTQIRYETGTDNRRSASVGDDVTESSYDSTGRLSSRRDKVSGRPYLQQYEYDGNDNLTVMTYASGRRIRYTYDGEGRITDVT